MYISNRIILYGMLRILDGGTAKATDGQTSAKGTSKATRNLLRGS